MGGFYQSCVPVPSTAALSTHQLKIKHRHDFGQRLYLCLFPAIKNPCTC